MKELSQDQLLQRFLKVESIARSSKVRRLLYHPWKYFFGIFFREIIYRFIRRGLVIRTKNFWGGNMLIKLPASMDIYLTGGKSDISELHLARFIIKNLRKGDHFFDVGAHVGYYSLLASVITGVSGRVLGAEPSGETYGLFRLNAEKMGNIIVEKSAVLNEEGTTMFFEFPLKYSEYDSIDQLQYSEQKWFKKSKIRRSEVRKVSGDTLLASYDLHPHIIKIDVEGSENKVIEGLKKYLRDNDPLVVMEFVHSRRNNDNHKKADSMLRLLTYSPFRIDQHGDIIQLDLPVDQYIDQESIESDNIIYCKQRITA